MSDLEIKFENGLCKIGSLLLLNNKFNSQTSMYLPVWFLLVILQLICQVSSFLYLNADVFKLLEAVIIEDNDSDDQSHIKIMKQFACDNNPYIVVAVSILAFKVIETQYENILLYNRK